MKKELVLNRTFASRFAEQSLREPIALTFSKIVADTVEWDAMTYRVLVDESISEPAPSNLQWGGAFLKGEDAEAWLLTALHEDFPSGDAILLVADCLALPQDDFLTSYGMPAVFLGNDVYYATPLGEVENFERWPRIFSNTPASFHGFLIRGRWPTIKTGAQLDLGLLNSLAEQVQTIVIGVYDGETYLLCTSNADRART